MTEKIRWILKLFTILAFFACPTASIGQIPTAPDGFYLEFPLKCGDPACNFQYNAGHETAGSVNSMLDHSMKQGSNGFWQYGSIKKGNADGVIIATDGTRFDGKSLATDPTCISGAFLKMEGQVLDFSALINSAGCGAGYMSYDEHPGYDYRAASQTPVFASASGKVVDLDGQRCVISNMGDSCDAWGFVGIDHGNGYISQYGHLDRIDVSRGQNITVGQQIGLSGRKSPPNVKLGAHLHFEVLYKSGTDYLVVDPYGWWGALDDPLYSASRVNPYFLWAATDILASKQPVDGNLSPTDRGIIGTWELVAGQCCGDMIGTDGLPWEEVSKAGRERVTFYSGGRFASTFASNSEGKWTLSDGTMEGWYIYLVGVEIRGDTMIVFHTPTSSQNAYAEKWQRVTSSNSGLQTDQPDKALSTSGGSAAQASSDTKPKQFIGYSNNDSCFGTVYRKSGCGSMDNLSLGGWGDYYYVFVQFDIDALPDLANGGRAEIWLWGSAPNDPNLVVEKITQRWSESSLSLNNAPASTPLSRAPSVPTNPDWIKIDITSLYKSWKTGAVPNYGIKLSPRRNEQTNGSFASSENENADIRPRLVVMPVRSP